MAQMINRDRGNDAAVFVEIDRRRCFRGWMSLRCHCFA
jgi:hypothetical protein